MKWFDRWFIKKITWIKPITGLTLDELYILREKIDEAIDIKINEHDSIRL